MDKNNNTIIDPFSEDSNILDNDKNIQLKIDPVIKIALEAYDTYQYKIQKIISKVKYVKFINNNKYIDNVVFFY
jgi:hypothetical protein